MTRRTIIVAAALAIAAGCRPNARTPDAELLVVSSDSTFWITDVGGRVQVRGVPMLVARVDGRFRELYVVDDDVEYPDASFSGHRLYSRDLIANDSVELHRDTTVARLAADYARTHPDESRLGEDDPESDNPSLRAADDVEILGLHGPYLSVERRLDVDGQGEGAQHRHAFSRAVLDVRTGEEMTAAALFGEGAARAAVAAARTEWTSGRDSLLASGRSVAAARRALGQFAFSDASFTLGSEARRPTIRFAVPVAGTSPNLEPIELSAQRIATPAWWADAEPQLPEESGNVASWNRGRDTLLVTADRGAGLWSLALHGPPGGVRRAGRVSSAVERVIWLDQALPATDRHALERAFAEAATYDGGGQIAGLPRAGSITAAALHLNYGPYGRCSASRAPRERVAARDVRADDAAGRERPWARVRRRAARDARQDGGGLCDAPRAQAVRHRLD